MEIGASWVTSERAKNAFSDWCASRQWVFQPTDGSLDFGKDGYVDVSDEGVLSGRFFAVQIKGGVSYSTNSGYRIPVGNHANLWMNSYVPVIGIVHDPSDGRLRWVNLTSRLREDPSLRSVFVDRDALVEDPNQCRMLIDSLEITSGSRFGGLPVGLGSPLENEQEGAIWDCFNLGFLNPAGLIAVRRTFVSFSERPAKTAIFALSHCTANPDIWWNKNTTLPQSTVNAVQSTFTWSIPEVWKLIESVDPEEGFDRGTIGQCVSLLFSYDKGIEKRLRQVAYAAAQVAPEISQQACVLLIFEYASGLPRDYWNDLLRNCPGLAFLPMSNMIGEWVDSYPEP
jgi:hypothetical protein